MVHFADIGGWQMLKTFLATLPEITAWVALLAGVGLMLGTILLMASLRWMLPWSSLHELRQARHGWAWMCLQWSWVALWGVFLPALSMTAGALVGSAHGARTLVLRESVGQVIGERVLAPVSVQLALQLQKQYPQWGDLNKTELETERVRALMEGLSPQLLNAAMANVRMLDEHDTRANAMELAGRRFARQAIHSAGTAFFREKSRFVDHLIEELNRRNQRKARLHEVIACASHLYFTPAFAEWTYWWVISYAAALVPILAGIWLVPWALFGLFWWWRNRRLRALRQSEPAGDNF